MFYLSLLCATGANRDIAQKAMSILRDPNMSSSVENLYSKARQSNQPPPPPLPPPENPPPPPPLPSTGNIFISHRREPSTRTPGLPGHNQAVPYPPDHGPPEHTMPGRVPPRHGPPGHAPPGHRPPGNGPPSYGAPHHNPEQVRNDPAHGSEARIRGLFSKRGSAPSNPVHQALALLSRDETFNPIAVVPNNDQNFVNEVERGLYDHSASVAEGIQRNTLYLLMKNEVMLSVS